jgi:hypothetical protein
VAPIQERAPEALVVGQVVARTDAAGPAVILR